MCGIAGIWGEGYCLDEVKRMVESLRHRGPDETGIHYSPAGALASTRLAIMDPAGGGQPIYNEDRTLAAVANGEIYNYPQLQMELAPDFPFRTGSDTEVILHLYQRDGIDAVRALNGMFAFAIADGPKLILARDPLGIKPLYYGLKSSNAGNELCYFASEMKTLLPFDIDIKAVPPGTTFSPGEKPRQFYSVPRGWVDDRRGAQPSESQIKSTLETAVAAQVMSDVPVGVFLSGGLDSSLVAAMARPHVKELYTFSVGLEGSPDLAAARVCAKEIGSIHHEKIFTMEQVVDKLPEIIRVLESYDPLIVRAAIPNYFCAQFAAEHVKVVLTGEGADELYAGYSYHKSYRSATRLHEELHRSTSTLHLTNLQRADRISMAHGLEARVPFLDTEVVRCAMQISPRRKIVRPRPWSRRVEKWALRQACKGVLSDKLLWREKETFNQGTGIDGMLPRLLQQYKLKTSLAEYQQQFFNDMIPGEEAMLYHHLLRERCDDSGNVRNNVCLWSRSVIKEKGVSPFRKKRLPFFFWRS